MNRFFGNKFRLWHRREESEGERAYRECRELSDKFAREEARRRGISIDELDDVLAREARVAKYRAKQAEKRAAARKEMIFRYLNFLFWLGRKFVFHPIRRQWDEFAKESTEDNDAKR